MSLMGKKKVSTDRHKPRKLVGISARICHVLEELGKDREATLTEMVKVACIEYLSRLGVWPPKDR